MLSDGTIDSLRGLDTCTVANAIETFDVRLRNEGFASPAIRALQTRSNSMVGYAATCRFRTSGPPPKQHRYIDRTDWWNFMLAIPAPRVAVFQDVDQAPGHGSILGEVHARILLAMSVAGAVTNGSFRDMDALRDLDFHLFAGGVCVSHSYAHIVEIGHPVEIGGLRIRPGDLLHGDRHGLQTIPIEIAGRIPEAAAQLRAREQSIIDLCNPDSFSLEKLKEAVAGL